MANSIYPRFSLLTFLVFEVNSLAENSKSDVIDFKYVYSGIEQRDLFEKIANDFSNLVDFSTLPSETVEMEKLYNCLVDLKNSLKGQERRKFGIEKNGLNLLLAFFIELIQRQSHEKTNAG